MRGVRKVHDNYCFKCGSYTEIDDETRLCVRCYRGWLDRQPAPRV
jgi:NMD protein affecting ribosome stability and mRNA decay